MTTTMKRNARKGRTATSRGPQATATSSAYGVSRLHHYLFGNLSGLNSAVRRDQSARTEVKGATTMNFSISANDIWGTIRNAASKAWAYTKSAVKTASHFLGIDKHTMGVGAAATVIAGLATSSAVGATTLFGATCATAAWAGLIAIPLMALYLVLNKNYRGKNGIMMPIAGAMNASALVVFGLVYGLYYAGYVAAVAGIKAMIASNMGAAFLIL